VEFFSKFIPNSFPRTATRSHLSPSVIGIIDGTVHKIRRPCVDQWKWWNEHYQFHAVHSLFLVSFDGEIISVATGVPGSFHDSCTARHIKFFQDVLKEDLVLGDPGFAGVPYVVSGFKTNQLTSLPRIQFDRISRSEQVAIEHINNFVKKCNILSKREQCIHSIETLSGCVLVGAGMYNYMRKTFNKYSN
jgi:hypothetical protein